MPAPQQRPKPASGPAQEPGGSRPARCDLGPGVGRVLPGTGRIWTSWRLFTRDRAPRGYSREDPLEGMLRAGTGMRSERWRGRQLGGHSGPHYKVSPAESCHRLLSAGTNPRQPRAGNRRHWRAADAGVTLLRWPRWLPPAAAPLRPRPSSVPSPRLPVPRRRRHRPAPPAAERRSTRRENSTKAMVCTKNV